MDQDVGGLDEEERREQGEALGTFLATHPPEAQSAKRTTTKTTSTMTMYEPAGKTTALVLIR